MKNKKAVPAVLGLGLCSLGLWLALSVPYHPQTFRIDAGGCGLVTDIVEPAGGTAAVPQGYVILLHGLAANKHIMSYLAQGFAKQGLRVFVPDLPGHGRTSGTFSYDRADQCSENLAQELVARGLLDPERTILAGHSLGGAIALRVASRFPVAGVVAISPAPMQPIRGIPADAIPFHDSAGVPANSLVMAGALESATFRDSARQLVAPWRGASGEYITIPYATHVSILFDRRAMSSAQSWAARALHLSAPANLPSRRPVLGFLLGLAGILLLSGPFLREIFQSKKDATPNDEPQTDGARGRAFLDYAILGLGAVGILSLWNPFRAMHLFEGDYFAGFLLILGVALLVIRWKSVRNLFRQPGKDGSPRKPWVLAFLVAFAAFLLHFLLTAWTDLTISEAWVTEARWLRFIPLLLAALPYHAAEELILGAASAHPTWRRLLFALGLRLTAWASIVAGIFLLHSGEILLVLLIPFLAIFCLLQTWAMKVVREVTASPAASALFGAILLAGFCLVAFPAT